MSTFDHHLKRRSANVDHMCFDHDHQDHHHHYLISRRLEFSLPFPIPAKAPPHLQLQLGDKIVLVAFFLSQDIGVRYVLSNFITKEFPIMSGNSLFAIKNGGVNHL